MIEINEVLEKNKKEAINALNSVGGNLSFDKEYPSVIVKCGFNDEVKTEKINSVAIDENHISMYIDEWGAWINECDCVSSTANNVYQKIIEQIFGK